MGDSVGRTAYAPFREEARVLLPADTAVLDAHTHLGVDEDGQSLELDALIAALDEVSPDARACTFPLHDPDRHPGYRRPNDRVLEWAGQSGGRVLPYCRLDPAEDPVGEAHRCLERGARGIKLHPRAQAFEFGIEAADGIFAVAAEAGVPLLVHAGRGMGPMDALADVALRHPDVSLVLAHAAIAGQGMFATRLADHPTALYDTSCLSPFDVIELFARVPAERVVFASDAPYGRPAFSLYQALRIGALVAGLDDAELRMLAGGTMAAVLDGRPLPEPRPPRVPQVRPVNGRLLRAATYLHMGFAALVSGDGRRDPARALPWIAMARTVSRDPDPGPAGEALARIDTTLDAAERLILAGGRQAALGIGLVHSTMVFAATEPVGVESPA
ncbi:MAG TPA: amidohydrolase family protein [Solirubrobacteraceae bacterium]|nr:amidohydrolase family protein [Solirubrobacteraceae bacterium]